MSSLSITKGLAQQLTNSISKLWFQGYPVQDVVISNCFKVWFKGGVELDNQLRKDYEPYMRIVVDQTPEGKKLAELMKEDEEGYMSLILMLDQFTRNVYRGTPDMISGDHLARTLTHHLIKSNQDTALPLFKRFFVYLPLEHSESLEDQHLCVSKFKQLYQDSLTESKEIQDTIKFGLSYAEAHLAQIETFNRFPHRNPSLNRQSTELELKFLELTKGKDPFLSVDPKSLPQ